MRTIELFGENRIKPHERERVGCRGIVIEDGKLLVSREEKTGIVMLPGGGLEEGESLKECCRRELLEETGYIVDVGECFLELDEFYGNCKWIGYYFICEKTGEGERRLTEEESRLGMAPVLMNPDEFLAVTGRHSDYAGVDEDRRGMYLRENIALREYISLKEGSP